MEAPVPKNPEFRRWLEAQNRHTRAVLDRISERPALLAELNKVSDVVTAVSQLQVSPTRWFYLRLAPGEQTPKLYARELKQNTERLLLDPDTLSAPRGSHWAIDYISPSPDGRPTCEEAGRMATSGTEPGRVSRSRTPGRTSSPAPSI